MAKDELIGMWQGRQDLLKPEYREKEQTDNLAAVRIYYTDENKYGFKIELHNWFYNMENFFYGSIDGLELKEAFSIIKDDDWNKSVDTSNWVKPDEESLKRILIEKLVLMELFDPESDIGKMNHAEAGILYSMLNSNSPTNPQIIMTYSGYEYHPLDTILSLMKHPERGQSFKLQDCIPEKGWDEYFYQIHKFYNVLNATVIKAIYKKPSKEYCEKMKKGFEDTNKKTTQEEKDNTIKKFNDMDEQHKKHVEKCEAVIAKVKEEFGFKPIWKKEIVSDNVCKFCSSKNLEYISQEDFLKGADYNTECKDCGKRYVRV